MPGMEQITLERHREQTTTDVKTLIDKYRSIFEWYVPEVDAPTANRRTIDAHRQALHAAGPAVHEKAAS